MIDIVTAPPLWIPPRPAIIRASDLVPPAILQAVVMPGMGAGLGAMAPTVAAGTALTAVTFRASSTSTSASITLPAGAADGDFCIIFEVIKGADGVAIGISAPSGWSLGGGGDQLGSGNTTHGVRFQGYWKVLNAADISAGSVTGADGSVGDAKIALCFKPNTGAVITTATIALSDRQSATGDPADVTIDATGAATPNVLVANVASDDTTPVFNPESPAFDAEVTVTRLRAAYKINASASHTFGQVDTADRNHVAGALFTFA